MLKNTANKMVPAVVGAYFIGFWLGVLFTTLSLLCVTLVTQEEGEVLSSCCEIDLRLIWVTNINFG